MPHDRLLTTTIGAFPKPSCTPIGDWFPDPDDTAAGAQGEGLLKRWERAGYEQRLAQAGDRAEEAFVEAIEEVVRDQVDAGIDIPTDGEVRRENYIFYQCRNLNGIDFECLTEKVARDGAFTARVPTITGAVTPRELVLARDWRIAKRVTDRSVKITLPGPMTIADSMANAFYPDPRTLGRALAEALNAEVRDLAAAGCRHIQVDEPVFARKPHEALEYGIGTSNACSTAYRNRCSASSTCAAATRARWTCPTTPRPTRRHTSGSRTRWTRLRLMRSRSRMHTARTT